MNKRKFIIICMICFLCTNMNNTTYAANDEVKQESSQTGISLQEAIVIAKTKLDINTENLELSSNYTQSNYYSQVDVWTLRWTNDDVEINVVVDANNKKIINYNKYYYNNSYENRKRISNYTEDDAKDVAICYIKKMNPDILEDINLMENKIKNPKVFESYNATYSFRYEREIDKIPYIDNYIKVDVDRDSLEVVGYDVAWDNEQVAKKDIKVTQEEANELYKQNCDFKLMYAVDRTEQSKTRERNVKLVYVADNYGIIIDAENGQVLNEQYYILQNSKETAVMEDEVSTKGINLTDYELKEIDKVDELITKEEALEIASKYLSKNFKLHNSRLLKSEGEYIWEFDARKNDSSGKEIAYQSSQINAKTKEILSMYEYQYRNDNNQKVRVKYSYDEAKKIADNYVEKITGNKFETLKIKDEKYNRQEHENERVYYYRYDRYYNDVIVPSNYVNIGIDVETGKIVNYNIIWNELKDLTTCGIDNILEKENAMNLYVDKLSIKPYYYKKYKDNYKEFELKLGYFTRNNDRFYMLADSGKYVNYNLKPYEENTDFKIDNENHWAAQTIKKLHELGILDRMETFETEKTVTKKEAKEIMSLAMKNNNYSKIYDESENTEITRLDVANMVIEMLGYKKLVELNSDIFINKYYDVEEKDKTVVSLVTALKIMNGTDAGFKPNQKLTMAEFAVIVYRMMNY